MTVINATNFKQRLGQYLDMAEIDPVIVEKSGRPKSVLISHAFYKRFLEMEDYYWLQQAKLAEKEGYIGDEETQELISNLSNAQA